MGNTTDASRAFAKATAIAKGRATTKAQRTEARVEAHRAAIEAARAWGERMRGNCYRTTDAGSATTPWTMERHVTPRAILAVDPGPTSNGFAIVHATASSHVDLIDWGECTLSDARHRVETYKGAVAVERVFFNPALKNFAALLETARVEQDLCTRVRVAEQIDAIAITSTEARRMFGLSSFAGTANDAGVKSVVERWVKGLPKRTSTHERDAMLLALAASRLIGAAWFLPKGSGSNI